MMRAEPTRLADTPPAGIRQIVLTRPAGENQLLREEIHRQGWGSQVDEIIDAPLLDFTAVTTDTLAPHLRLLQAGDWLIFVSPRAVGYAFARHPELAAAPVRFACVGKATQAALQQQGVARIWAPGKRFDSEGLLAQLADQPMQNRRVVIVRGMTGRNHLAEALTARGAKVAFCPVYECHCQSLPASLAHPIGCSQLFVITAPISLECLANQSQGKTLLESNLVVINQRALEKARRLGFAGGIAVAGSPESPVLAKAVGHFLKSSA